jgi:hypothetical protein
MISKRLIGIAALLGAVLVSAGATAAFQPFSTAEATNRVSADSRSEILGELSVGSEVSMNDDGSISFQGRLNAEAADEAKRINEMSSAGPAAIRCEGNDARVVCSVVPDEAVLAAIRSGERIYGRMVYGDLSSAVASGVSVLDLDELVCDGHQSDGTMVCSRAGEIQPVLAKGEKMLVTYKLYRLRAEGPPGSIVLSGRPAVPVASE